MVDLDNRKVTCKMIFRGYGLIPSIRGGGAGVRPERRAPGARSGQYTGPPLWWRRPRRIARRLRRSAQVRAADRAARPTAGAPADEVGHAAGCRAGLALGPGTARGDGGGVLRERREPPSAGCRHSHARAAFPRFGTASRAALAESRGAERATGDGLAAGSLRKRGGAPGLDPRGARCAAHAVGCDAASARLWGGQLSLALSRHEQES